MFKELLGNHTLEFYHKRREYNQEGELLKLGVIEKRALSPPGAPPAPFKHDNVEGYTRWEHAHCYTVYLDLVEHKCLVVDPFNEKASSFEKRGHGKVEGTPDKPVEVVYKVLVKLLNEGIPLFTADGSATSGAAAKGALLQSCRFMYGPEDGSKNNCVTVAFAIATSFISTREDFKKEWEKASNRCFFVKREQRK